MTREQLRSFLRALLATLLAGLMLWLFARLGVTIPVPQIQPSLP